MEILKKANTGATTSGKKAKKAKSNVRVRKGFNNKGTIDLNQLPPCQMKFQDATFSHFEWLELQSIDFNSSNWKNIGIRDDKDYQSRRESFQVAFRLNGYDMTEFPPCICTNGEPIEGRTRIAAAQKNGEKWMPVAIYTRTKTGLRNTITNGLRANQKKPQYNSTFGNFVASGVELIQKGVLANTETAVDDWLYHDVDINRSYDNQINGMVTKIRNAILSRSRQGQGLIWHMTKAEAEKWILTSLGLTKGSYVLVNTSDNSGETYAERAWRHVRDALKNNRAPVRLIFYTTDDDSVLARAGLKKSMQHIENLYVDAWEVVKSQLPAGISLTIPTVRPFIFEGALPQIIQAHPINGYNLVPVNKY